MKTPEGVQVLFTTRYGSHLYGTDMPTSDLDEKVVYLPPLVNVLLGKKLQTFKKRFDVNGAVVPADAVMPDNGVETEYVPFQTFCRDFMGGQTYALEVAFAALAKPGCPEWLQELVHQFLTCNVSSMAGFAMKQTFDYVHRGERLEKARLLQQALLTMATNDADACYDKYTYGRPLRLDHVVCEEKVLHTLAQLAGLELGTTVNNGKEMETLKLNGRDYLETTTVEHLLAAVTKLVDSYGHRSAAAAEAEVDRKSLMHAVRVYGQALELLETGKLTFPNPEAALLLRVKTELPLEQVKVMLRNLEAQLEEAVAANPRGLPQRTPGLDALFDQWLLEKLRELYGLR